MHRERLPLTVPGENKLFLDQLLPRCSFPLCRSKFSSGAAPGARGLCRAGRALPELPGLLWLPGSFISAFYTWAPSGVPGLPPSQHQLSCWISKAVFASSLCVCVSAEGAVPQPRVICTISLYPSKSDRANNSSNLAEWMTNSLCQVNFVFPLQFHFFLLLHNESELTISTFSHCMSRRVDLLLLFYFSLIISLFLLLLCYSRLHHGGSSVPHKPHSFTPSPQSSWRALLH